MNLSTMASFFRISLLLSSIFVVSCLLVETKPIVESSSQGTYQVDAKDGERLRQMFQDSHKLALQGLYESNALDLIQRVSNASKNNSILSNNPLLSIDFGNNPDKIAKGPVGSSSTVEDQTNSNSREEDRIAEKLKGSTHNDLHLKNDARQAYLFPGLARPTFPNAFGSTNPLMAGLPPFRPLSMPSFPTFPTPRPPKTSIIGNNGGAMALTNDNVVVVNVLSSNF